MVSLLSLSKRRLLLGATAGFVLVALVAIRQWTTVVIGRVESSGGDQIAYVKLADGSSLWTGDLYILDVNRNTTIQLTRNMKVGGALWMPDGDHLAIIERPRGSVLNYHVLNVRTGDMRPIDYAEFQRIEADSGGRIPFYPVEQPAAFTGSDATLQVKGDMEHICLTQDGSEVCQRVEPYSLALSPDETRMAYVSGEDGAQAEQSLCITRMQVDAFASASCFDSNPYGFHSLDWQPLSSVRD